jgi:hypothetical protein
MEFCRFVRVLVAVGCEHFFVVLEADGGVDTP